MIGIICVILFSLKHRNSVATYQVYIIAIIISKLSFLSLFSETAAGYACIHDRTDASPLHYGTAANFYALSRPRKTPAMQSYATTYDHF